MTDLFTCVGVVVLYGGTPSDRRSKFDELVEASKIARRRVVTVENPFAMKSWSAAVDSAMRLDPDVLGITDMDSPEGAMTVLRALVTGHSALCISAFQTDSALMHQLSQNIPDKQEFESLRSSLTLISCNEHKAPRHSNGMTKSGKQGNGFWGPSEVGTSLKVSGMLALIVCMLLADVVLAIGWLLSILEVPSIYARLLPDWTAMHYFLAFVATTVAFRLLKRL